MEYILYSENITKKYRGKKVLNNVSIHVQKGSVYGLIGKNGSGKTTLLRIITGLIKNKQGRIYLSKELHNEETGSIAAIVDSPVFIHDLSAEDNLKAQCLLLGINDKNHIKKTLMNVGLSDSFNKKADTFSLGMKQRLALAISTIGNPNLLILDEPLNGLDPEGIAEFRELILKLNKEEGMTIIISSHILSELSQVATHYGILDQGQLVKEFSKLDYEDNGFSLETFFSETIRRK